MDTSTLIFRAGLAAVLCFLLFLAVHVLLFRLVTIRERYKAIRTIFLCLLPVYAGIFWLLPDCALSPLAGTGVPREYWYLAGGGLLYLLLYFGYCSFYFIVDRSMSTRIPAEIAAAPGGKLSFAEIKQRYDLDDYLQRRLDHLLYGGYLTCSDDVYRNTSRGIALVRLTVFCKKLLRLGRGG